MRKGFTLIELLVVISIIAILSALLMANFIGIRQRSRDATRKSDLQNIRQALELYRADVGAYPSSGSDPGEFSFTQALIHPNSNFSDPDIVYMSVMPRDPLGRGSSRDYQYIYDSGNNTYELIACLENSGDSDIAPVPDPNCSGNQPGTFRLANP